MATREVKVGIASFVRADGPADSPLWGFGLFGDEVDVHEDDLERFDRLNGPAAAPIVPLPEVAPENDIAGAEPPRSGKGSGAEAWITYARSVGLDVDDGASRDDVIALVDAAK